VGTMFKAEINGFKEFIFRGNVVDLAVAVIIGTAFSAVVKALVADIFTPLIAAIAGKPNFASLEFKVHHSTFFYGDLLNNLITFASIAAVVYFFVVLPLNKVAERRAKGVTPVAEVAEDVVVLTEIRDLLARQIGGAAPAES
jgi:large conductance mechanosensitive channel